MQLLQMRNNTYSQHLLLPPIKAYCLCVILKFAEYTYFKIALNRSIDSQIELNKTMDGSQRLYTQEDESRYEFIVMHDMDRARKLTHTNIQSKQAINNLLHITKCFFCTSLRTS